MISITTWAGSRGDRLMGIPTAHPSPSSREQRDVAATPPFQANPNLPGSPGRGSGPVQEGRRRSAARHGPRAAAQAGPAGRDGFSYERLAPIAGLAAAEITVADQPI